MTCPFSYSEWTKGCGRCKGCGAELPLLKKTGAINVNRVWCPRKNPGDSMGSCEDPWYRNHDWTMARIEALRRAKYHCANCGETGMLEVNHIGPRYGGGYGSGCHNHQDNLETLCHKCHLKVTAQQREARKHEGQAVMELAL